MRLPRSRRLLPSTVLLLVLAGTSCGRQEVPDAAPPDAGGPSPAPGDAREFRDAYATAGLPAESPPTLVVLSPDTDEEFWLGETATPVNLTFLVENWTWPAAGRSVTCSVDGGVFGNPPGQPDPGPTGPASHIFEDVPVGRHRLCCTLTENGIPLSNCEATGCIDVTVSRECEYLTDPVCGDGNPCSADACLYDASIDHRRCIYGEVLAQDCCLSDMDCGCGPAGWQICVDGACKDCEDSGDCDDGNPCTVDQCSGGACSFQWSTLPGGTCCTGTAADGAVCDDGLYCTADLCSGVDPVTGKGTCVHPDAGYPDCCDSHGDCSDGNPCTSNVCMAHECRQAPVLDPLCCNPAMGNQDCDTGNPCEIGTCIVSTNQCVFSDLPFPDQLDGGPHCCEVHPDCMPGGIWEEDGDNDGDPGPNLPNTLDFCQGGQCAHVTDENFCTCMAGQACDHPCVPDSNVCTTDACVSNQCMHHPVPGCCLTAADCKDSDLCTTESCVGNVCVFGQVPDCCNKHTDCEDGNPCNVDACISKKCHHASNPAFPDCCSSDLDCDDNRECTSESCHVPTNTCLYSLVEDHDPPCCFTSSQCDDGVSTNLDVCYKNQCYNLGLPGMDCLADADCDDGNVCTQDLCDGTTSQCAFPWIQGCCSSDVVCNLPPILPDLPENDCTVGTCDPGTSTCVFETISECCSQDQDCDDGLPCTADHCIDRSCRHVPQAGCCTSTSQCNDGNDCTTDLCSMNGDKGTCQVMVVPDGTCCATAQECNDNEPCTKDLCIGYYCYHVPMPCCTKQNELWDCNDGNPCTCDVCVYGSCRHFPPDQLIGLPYCQIPPICCVETGDCASDDNPCTVDTCTDSLCTYTLLDPCVMPLPFRESFNVCNNAQPGQGWLLGKGWRFLSLGAQDATSNWACATGGGLGGGKHQRFGWAPPRADFESYLVTPALDAAGPAFVTIQYREEFDYFDDASPPHPIERSVWIIQDTKAPAGPDAGDSVAPVWTDPMVTEDVLPRLSHRVIPASSGLLGPETYVAWSVGGASTFALTGFRLDEVEVCAGRPPVFQDHPEGRITLSARTGAARTIQILVSDPDAGELTFSLPEAPSFVSIPGATYNPVQKTYSVSLKIGSTSAASLGRHEVVLQASDGCLEAELRVELWILTRTGYVVWDPVSGPHVQAFSDALVAAIAANGREVQRVQDLTLFDDLSGLAGVFVTLGVQGVDTVLVDSPEEHGPAIDRLLAWLSRGGRVYLEGGNTWGFDPPTALHAPTWFPVSAAAGAPGIYPGPVVGRHFCWQQDFGVTTNPVLNNAIDTMEKLLGSPAIPVLADAQGLFKLAVAHEDPQRKARTLGASLPFADLVEIGLGTRTGLMSRYLQFFEQGWPPCSLVQQCDDSEICTLDACVTGACTNGAVDECIPCDDDQPCTAAAETKACRVSQGLCDDVGGTLWKSFHGPMSIGFGTPAVSSLSVAATGTIQDLNVKVFIQHNYRGDLAISVSHAGVTVPLKEPDVADNGKHFYFTYDFGLPEEGGDLGAFSGIGENGTWTLTVEDHGVPFGGALLGWSLFVVNDAVLSCDADGDCEDGNGCTLDLCQDGFCQHLEDPCTAGSSCQVFEACDPDLGCLFSPVNCDDGDPCTADSCDPVQGCKHPPVQYCAGAPCATHGDCGYDDYCHYASGTCKPIPADQIHHCWDVLGVCPQDVPDLGMVVSAIQLNDTGHVLDGLRVKVKVTHPASGQLTVSLSDGAATLDLHRLTGGAADDVFRVYELADPAHVPGSLSQLLGQHPDGTWTLRVQDSLAGDIGQLEYWSLYLDLADLLDDGEPCATDDQCLSDYCGNGFCCQGTGSGDCCAVKTDCVNHGGVVYWAAAVCDIPADCQGHRLEPSCAGFECVATLVADDSGCAGEEAAPCLDCRPLPVCTAAVVQDDPSARCPDTCGNDDAVCSAGCHCDGTSALPQGICVTDLDVGDPCVEESDCLDGQHCQNGVCCPDGKVCCTTWGQCPNAGGTLDPGILQYSPPSCGLTPATCQGARKDKACQDAQCTALTVADDRGCGPDVLHSLCGFYPSVFCDGTAEQVPSCASSCTSDDGCDPDAHCTGGLCVADYSDGHACDDGDGLGDSECVSAHCGNGFCCAAGDCCAAPADCLPAGYATPAWCASPETCQGFRRDALCLAFSCATGGVVADDSACDELLDCAPYLTEQCDGAPDQPVAACPDTCETDADCVPAAHCRAGPPDGLKHCYYKKYDGEDCDGSWECVSGNCGGPAGQTVCCAAGKDCCPGNDPATCPLSYTGAAACDGPGLCQGTRRDPACATWVCASTTVEDDRGCTSGFVASSLDCGCYPSPACNGQEVQAPACPTSCTGDGQCEVPCHCDGGCVGDLGNGEPCDEPSDCITGYCAPGGVCCDRACDGGCVTCGGSWETRTVDIDGDLAGADDFDPLVHRLGIGEGGVGYYLTWDDQYLYAAWTGPVDTAHAVYLALDANPDPAADQGAGGVIGGLVFPGDRKPEYAVAFTESDGIWLTLAAGGNWVSPAQDVCTVLSCWSHYAGLPGNPTWELRIPRASIPLVDPDAGFAVWMWSTGKPGGQVWSAWPPATGNGPVVSGPDAQFVVAGPGMCRNRTINTDPAGACAGSCRTCDGAGACMDAVAGTDPEDQCTAADPLSCGLTGACAAGGGCAWWPGTTPCAGATCAGSVRLAASFCSGVAPGACVPSGSEDCYPHACVVDACVDPCTDNAHCLGPHYCNDRPLNGPATGACEPLLADGFFCDETSDCAHGHCVQIGDAGMGPDVGVCCATACDGACEDCLTGACVPRADGTDPGGECGGCEVCDGAGGCRAVDPGADPDPDPKAFCAQTPLPVPPTVWSCGLSGRCDGLGGCEPWHSGETCHTAQCEACQISALADTCAADGTCTDHGAGAICAGGLACRTSTACYATCALDTHCCGVTAPQLCHASLACSPCTDQPVCPTNGADCCGSDSCADERDLPSLLGSYVIRTSTQGARNEFSHGGMGAVAPDRVFRLVTGAAPVQLVAAVSGTKTGGAAVDTYLFLRVGDCATGAVIAANDDCGGNPAAGSCLTAILAPSSVFHLVLDGRGASTDRGDLALSVTLSTYCGNGTCDPGETCGGCADCSPCCGDGSCDLLSGENGCTCPGDCNGALGSDNACGDGCCSAWDCGALCAADCNLCTGCGFCTVPQGALETQTPLGGGLHEVFGWACDPDHTALPVTVELFDNGLSTGIFSVAGESRPDDPGGAACGTSVGFSPNLQLVTEGGHTITARAANADPGQPPAWLAGSLCIGVCGTRVCGTDGCTGSCGTCPSGCDHDGDGTYSRTPGTCTAGQCAAAQPCATGYACNGPLSKADGDFCATACQDDDDDYCADGYTCEGTVCTSKAGVGEPCDENGDCISLSCRKEIDSSDYYCTDPGKECSEAGAAGYDTGDHTGAWLCTGPNTSKECKFNTVCDTWVGHFCTATDVWGEGSGEGHVCSTGPFCSNDTRHVGRTCNGGSGNAGACTKNGPKGFGCDSETALGEEHCEGNSWTSVGATSCCEDDGDGHGIASDPCTGKSAACVASRTCLDGADLCGMQPQGTLCGGTGYCLATDPDWCAPGKSNGSACAFDYECASKNCDPDLAGVKRCHATATSCVQGATGAETPSGGSLCINTSQWRPCSDATWGVAVACTGCSACSGGACVDVDANCVQSPWDGCASTCVKTRSNSGVCTAGVCGTASGYVAAGKVCSGGAEVAPSGSGYCDAQATCVTGTCAATISLRGCSGTGVACSAAALVPGGAWNAPSGEVISETVTRVASSPAALSCASSVTAYCDGTDHCAGDDRWDGFTCNGQGACTVDKGDVGCCAHSDCAASQYCDTDFQCKVLSLCGERKPSALGQQPQAAGADARDECAESGWDGCASTCVRTRSNSGTCKGSTYACGTVATFLSEAGKVCSAGAEVAPTAANRCDTWIGCAAGACGAPLYHRGCAAGAATCSSTGQVAAGSWSAPYGQTVTDASGKAGSSCATAASLCDGTDHCLGDDRYSGWVCDGSGACSAPSGDIGCCGHTDCGGTQYCRGADYQCQALSTCGKRTAGAFGQEHQAATEDLRGECAQAGCASGLCLGTDYACNPGGKIEPPEAVTGGIRYCPGSVTLQASGSSGAFAWYASPTGGSPLASGPVFETPPILETTTYWVEAVEAYPFPAHVLVFDENCLSDWPTPYRDAMDNLAWNYTRAVDEIDFVNRLTDGTVWDIVVFDRYYYITQNSVYDRLYAYLAGGGKLIFSNWKFTSHALFSAMDVSYNSTFYSGKTIYAWNAAHPLYNLPNTVPTSIASTQDTCNVDGFYSYVIGGGVAVSGFQATPQAGRAAVVVNSEGASIYMGEMPYLFNEAVLGDFLENQLMYLATDGWTGPGSGGICASGRIPVIAEIGSLAAPSTGDVTTTCGGTATFTASGSTGKYQWWDAASGGTRVATGSSHTTPPIFTTTHRWVEAVDSYATSARILVADLVYSNLGYPCAAPWMTPYKDTLADMGLAFTSVTTNQTDFRTRLQSQAWDLVIYDDYTQTPAAATLDLLKAHLDGGGRLIFASPFTGTHALYAAMNVGFNGAFTQPKDLYAWEPSHDLYTVPNVVPSPVEWAWNVCSQDGVRLVNNGGVAVAGFTAVAADGQAAVVLGAGGRSIVMGQVPYTFNQASLEGFLENQIAYMVGLGDGCISSRVQATATVPGGCVAGCTHSIRLYDSYGDGWDTASVDVAVNGVTVLTGLTFATGYGPATFTFTAAAGSAVAVTYHPGQWPGENYYRVYDGGGNIIALATASSTTGTGACP